MSLSNMTKIKTPRKSSKEDDSLPTAEEMLEAYQAASQEAMQALMNCLQGVHRLAGERPELAPSMNSAHMFLETGFLWLQNCIASVAVIQERQQKETSAPEMKVTHG